MVFEELSFPSSGATTTSGLTAGTLDLDVDVLSPAPPRAGLEGHGGGFGSGSLVEVESYREDKDADTEVGLYHMGDHTQVCCGIIGGTHGTRFCTLAQGKCTIKAHGQKAPVMSDALYVKTGRRNTARVSPRVTTLSLPPHLEVKELLKQQKPVSAWVLFLEHAKETTVTKVESIHAEEEIEFVYAINKLEDDKDEFKTPARPGLGSLLSDMVDSSPKGDAELTDIKPLVEDASIAAQDAKLLLIIENWNDLVSNVKILDQRMKKMKEVNHNYKESLHKVMSETSNKVLQTRKDLRLLNEQVGMAESYAFDAFTVRDWIKNLQSDVNALEKRLGNANDQGRDIIDIDAITELEGRMQGVEEMIEIQQEGSEELEASMNKQFAAVQRTFANLQQAGAPVRRLGRTPRMARQGNGVDAAWGTLKRDVKLIKEEIEELRTAIEHPTFATIQEEGQEGNHYSGEEEGGLAKRVKELETRLGEQGFSGGDEVFASFSDVKQWVISEGIESSGIFWDLLSVLIAMEPSYMSGKEFADAEYSSERIKSTALETDLSASMKQHRPRVLFASSRTGPLPKIEKGFGACTTYKEWIGGAESFKSEVSELVKGFRGGVKNVILSERGEWSERGCTLALELLAGVRDQWSELVSFIDSFYQLLTDVANFSPQKAWALVGRCVATVFTAMRSHREKVFKMRDDGSSKNRANIIWAVLQCHRVMHDFIKVDFKGHPLIVQAINTFMITERVDPELITKALDRVKTLEGEKHKLNSTITKLEEVVAALSRSHKDLANEVKQLKKK